MPTGLLVLVSSALILAATNETDGRKSNPSTIDEARAFVIGEWTAPYDDVRATRKLGGGIWEYLSFSADGTAKQCTAFGNEEAWRCERVQYEVFQARYQDTGEEYFGIRIGEDQGYLRYTIVGDEIKQTSQGDVYPYYKRGNRHPLAPSP